MERIIGSVPQIDWQSRDLPGAWSSFKEHSEFMFGGPLKDCSEAEQCNYLMIWVGKKGREIYKTFALTDEEKIKLKNLYEQFDVYVKPKSNQVFARYLFHAKVQENEETFENFVTELKLLARDCGYQQVDEMVRDRIVFGVKSAKVRARLIQEGSSLTLEKAVDIGRTMELSDAQLKTMTGDEVKIHGLKLRDPKQSQRSGKTADSRRRQSGGQLCGKCGYSHLEGKCPAKGKQCNKCHKYNHFAKMCKSGGSTKDKRKIHGVDIQEQSSDEEGMFIGCVQSEINVVDKSSGWFETLTINSKPVKFQLDTGAKCNTISTTVYKSLGLKQRLTKSDMLLKSYSGHPIVVNGTVTLPVTYKAKIYSVKFYIVDVNASPVLGPETCQVLNLVRRVHEISKERSNEQPTKRIGLKDGYPELCEGLGCLPGKYSIKLKPDATPVIHPPRKVPIALKDSIKTELDRMEAEGVVAKVLEPTEWVNSMVTVVKPNGKLRICIDPKDLNKEIEREHYPMKTVEEVLAQMAGAKVFSVLDAQSGFWQICLDEASSKLCTFNTPFGRYRFTRLPFGIKSAPEVFQRAVSRMLENLPGVDSIMDDIIVWGRNVEEHDERLRGVLERAKSHQLRLNVKKCKIRQPQVSYVGHLLTSEGVKADPEKIRAVIEMERPKDLSEVRRFLGFIQYLSKFLPSLSKESAPLRKLVEKDTAWHWEKSQEESFRKLKSLASSTPVLQYYDVKKPVKLSVDASSQGLGAVLLQDDRPVAYASRALTTVQQQYAQIEKELLAIVYGCKKFHQYVYGKEVEVETDHQPLQSIFKKSLHQAPSRLQKMLLQLQSYNLTVTYKSGKDMYLADTLSRSHLNETKETLVSDLNVNVIQMLAMSPEKYREFQEATSQDPVLESLRIQVLQGWPDSQMKCPLEIRSYWTFREDISYQDGLLFKSDRVIVPKALRSEMLSRIHESHFGMNKSKQRARELLFWPGMSSQIEDVVAKCDVCATHQSSNPREPMIVSESPSRPWEKVGCDLLEFRGSHYLVCVDYYSNWPELARLENLSSRTTVTHLKSMFARYGIPDVVRSDNGPQFSSQCFEEFQKSYGFKHETSSPRYPQSNGEAERCVQTVKNILKKAQDPYKALLEYRTTPLEGIGLSPSQLLMNRRLKSTIPVKKSLLMADNADQVKKALDQRKLIQKTGYDRRCGRELPPFEIGQKVRIQKDETWVPATVVGKQESPRSYIVKDDHGSSYRRNRRHLRANQAMHNSDIQDFSDAVIPDALNPKSLPDESSNTSSELCSPEGVVCTRSGRVSVPPKRYESSDFRKK